ncbi:conjugative transfer pilus assembly protein TraH [Modicisalibacter xianhensis]|uniref:Conjugative transfer pilus assembly protein TraH n=1 Tax=Modicisalibacter xianhensis TaxID=442341 RepID=A0A4R8FD04_9GAMM|nr:conjugal transfer protein TraH [Halomonas xianhensis]TDX23690.1 conjugative transfer pilus assembly protein TraH [Halomonas xianhensis]
MKTTVLAACVSAALLTPIASSANGLQAQLDRLFDGMTQTTQAGVWETQRRGVIAGGRTTAKTNIMTTSLVQVSPPSWKAGCGGVDLFGGSFSFINSDQLVQLLRTVAANATGYAFQLALSNVFPDGAAWIENFQKKIQAMNQAMANSCQLAQGLVNDTVDAMNVKLENDVRTDASAKGVLSGFFDGFTETSGSSTRKELKNNSPDEYQQHIGNIMWKQLRHNGAHSWFAFGDNAMLESIMSLTGTVIIRDLEDDSNPVVTLPGNLVSLSDFIDGGNIEVYSCTGDSSDCMIDGADTTKTVSLKGLRKQILDLMLGDGLSIGMIDKLALNQATASNDELAFVSNLPNSTGSLVRSLAALNPSSARLFVNEAAGAIALNMVYYLGQDMLRAGKQALSNSRNPHARQALDILNESEQRMMQDYQVLSDQYGSLPDLIRDYNAIIENVRKQKYMLSSLTNQSRGAQ